MLLTKRVQVKWLNATRKYYESKGYNFTKYNDEFEINIEDAPPKSNSIYVEILCDYCLEKGIHNVFRQRLADYTRTHDGITKKDCCNNCKFQKMSETTRNMPWKGVKDTGIEPPLTREWLVTNGLGGYASGTVSGAVTRRYHGFLIAALSAPLGRTVMLNHLAERIIFSDGSMMNLGSDEMAENVLELPGAGHLTGFRLERGMPIWRYEMNGFAIEKSLILPSALYFEVPRGLKFINS
jgi:glycogen debranching enzyme